MTKTGYWNVRITPSLRGDLDHMALLLGDAQTDIDCVRFALAFTIAVMPERVTGTYLLDTLEQVREHLVSLRVYDETYPTAVQLMGDGLRARVRESKRWSRPRVR